MNLTEGYIEIMKFYENLAKRWLSLNPNNFEKVLDAFNSSNFKEKFPKKLLLAKKKNDVEGVATFIRILDSKGVDFLWDLIIEAEKRQTQ